MRKRGLFIVFILLAGITGAQTLSPVTIGGGSGIFVAPPNKSLSYGVNHISLISATQPADSISSDIQNNKLQVYPNPGIGNIWLKFQSPGQGKVTVFISDNSNNKTACFDMNVTTTDIINRQIDISKLSAGDYLMNLIFTPLNGGGRQMFVRKFQVMR